MLPACRYLDGRQVSVSSPSYDRIIPYHMPGVDGITTIISDLVQKFSGCVGIGFGAGEWV